MGNKNTDDILEMHDEQATMNWEFVDTDQLNHEISELTKKFNKVSSLITRFYDFTTANEMIKELYSKELTQAGKLLSFVVLNEEIFPGSLSDLKSFPKFYADLTPEKQKKYKELYEYWSFLKSLEPVCTKTCELLMSLPLLPGYKLSYIKSNLEEKGYSSSLYQQISSDALSLMEQVNQPWDSLESRANNNALPYLKQGFKEGLSTRELEKYKKARSEDYKADVEKRCSFFRTSLTFSSNRFKLKPDIVPRMTVLDKYSYKSERMILNLR